MSGLKSKGSVGWQINFRTIDIKSKKKGHKKLRYLHNPIIAENAESIGANQSEV